MTTPHHRNLIVNGGSPDNINEEKIRKENKEEKLNAEKKVNQDAETEKLNASRLPKHEIDWNKENN